ncbi:MAG: hypothetical protein SFW08_07235 [Gemmatimonadaceae bacterium]|nr:hypothetical protein [Gemmatimonadaceae bacterium]
MTNTSLLPALVVALILSAVPLRAQDSTTAKEPGRPTADLLRVARDAADNLRYAEAGKTALSVLSMTGTSVAERVDALQLAALAAYAEEDSAARNEVLAVNLLRQRFRLMPNQALERRYSWAGLDNLYQWVARTEVVVDWRADSVQRAVSVDGRVRIDGKATRPVRWKLAAVIAGRARTLDSTASSTNTAELQLATFDGTAALLPSGTHRVLLIGGDSVAADTAQFDMDIDAPPLQWPTAPPPLDSTALERETKRPIGLVGATVRGLVFGGITAAVATQLRPDEPLRSGLSSNGAALGSSAALAVAVTLLAARDAGVPDVGARQRNAQKRSEYAAAVEQARAEAADRRATYTVTAVLRRTERRRP